MQLVTTFGHVRNHSKDPVGLHVTCQEPLAILVQTQRGPGLKFTHKDCMARTRAATLLKSWG